MEANAVMQTRLGAREFAGGVEIGFRYRPLASPQGTICSSGLRSRVWRSGDLLSAG